MRLKRVSLRGLTTFHQTASVDFEALGPGLVAVVGPNGSGKTSLLESVVAALYKRLPSRSGIYEHFAGRDGFVEAVFLDGDAREIALRLLVDAEKRYAERYATIDGQPVTTGKQAEVDAFVLEHFGSEQLFLASAFAAQTKAGSFLLLSKAERKTLFAELLGLGRLQLLSETARERKTSASATLGGTRTVLARLEAELGRLPSAEAAFSAAQTRAMSAVGELTTARRAEDKAKDALAEARGKEQAYSALVQADAAAQRELRAREQAVNEAEALAPRARQEAERRRRGLPNPLTLTAQVAARHTEACAGISKRRQSYEADLALEPEIRAAAERLPFLEERERALAEARDALSRAERAADVAEIRSRDGREALDRRQEAFEEECSRLSGQTEMLSRVPCEGALQALCPLLADANLATKRLATLQPPSNELQVEADEIFSRASANCAAAERALVELEQDPDAGDVTLDRARVAAAALQSLDVIRRELAGLGEEQARVDAQLKKDTEAANAEAARIAAEKEQIESDLAEAIMEAGELLQAAHESLVAAECRANDARRQLQDAAAVSIEAAEIALADAKSKVATAEATLRGAEREAARLEADVASLTAKVDEVARERATLAGIEAEVGDWTLLERGLGRDGIQALEIDAAGPEVAAITNELLEACYGSRFSLRLETLREKKTKAGEYSEAFDVRVYDRGQERQVEALSGGEKVVVGEALGLGIAIFQSRRNGSKLETIFRDETSGALDEENAAAYADMLRRALTVGGFFQCVFVAHQRLVWERADARIHVDGGTVRLG